MVNYEQGKIYKIVCRLTGRIYIGSTCEKYLSNRLTTHRQNYKQWKDGKRTLTTSFLIIDKDDYYIELVELFPCSCVEELRAREGHFQRSVDCINKRIEGRTSTEYRNLNKEKIEAYNKAKFECLCGAIVSQSHKARHEKCKEHLHWQSLHTA